MNTNQTLPEKAITPNTPHEKNIPEKHENGKDNFKNDKKPEGSDSQKAIVADKHLNKESDTSTEVETSNKDGKEPTAEPKLTQPNNVPNHKM